MDLIKFPFFNFHKTQICLFRNFNLSLQNNCGVKYKMNKNLDKLKHFFRSNKSNSSQERVYVLNSEIERELRKESSNEKRIKLLRDLGEMCLSNRLEEVIRDDISLSTLHYKHPLCFSLRFKSFGHLRAT